MDYKEQITNRITLIRNEIYSANNSKMGISVGVDESRIRSYTQKNISKRSMPSSEFITLLDKVGINPEWVLFGTGEMLKSASDSSSLVAESRVAYADRKVNVKNALIELSEMVKKQQDVLNGLIKGIDD